MGKFPMGPKKVEMDLLSEDIFDKSKSNLNFHKRLGIVFQFQTIWEVAQLSSLNSKEVTIKIDLFFWSNGEFSPERLGLFWGQMCPF